MDEITITWHVDDLLNLNEDLTLEQRREVLRLAEKYHDCNHGINWDILQTYAWMIKKEGIKSEVNMEQKIYKIETRIICQDEIESYEKCEDFTDWRDVYLNCNNWNPKIQLESCDFEDWKPYCINNIEYYESRDDAECAIECFRFDKNWYPADYQVIEKYI